MEDELLVCDRTGSSPTDGVGATIATSEEPIAAEGAVELLTAPGEGLASASASVAAEPAPAVVPGPGTEPEVEPDLPQIIEALLFASDTPLSVGRLAELAGGCTPTHVRKTIAALNEKYAAVGLAFRIESIARGYQMMTLPCYQPWLARLNKQRARTRLSAAALETLSIVAYKQPIIRADIEAIRGVACGEVLNRLREMGLVRIVGRAEVVGRPLLYGTTKKFLDVFGLADLDDLPPMEALTLRRRPEPAAEGDEGPAALAASA